MLDDKVYKPGVVLAHISRAKNSLLTPETYLSDRAIRQADESARIPMTGKIYSLYRDRCRLSDAMDFDDLLLYTYLLFTRNPDICSRYAERFKFVLVDEYQDTNFAQHAIVWELTKVRQRVCVVGDDAQSIYSFRGANIDNILNFTRQYNEAQVFKLEQNYRSTQTIVEAANSLIGHNNRQIQKAVFSVREKGEPIRVFPAYSDLEEAEIVANKLNELHRREHLPYDELAVLYRTNAQSRAFEEALRKRNLPYRIYGGLSFYQRKEIKDVIAYFRMSVNPNDEEAFKRIVNYPARGIGPTTVDKIQRAAVDHGVSLWEVVSRPLEYGLSVNKGTLGKLQAFAQLIDGFMEKATREDADGLAMAIVRESGILADTYQDNSQESKTRQENIQELLGGIQEYVAAGKEEGRDGSASMADFLQEVSLWSDQDEDKAKDEPKITLMTIHSAKGLEFKAVFVVGMEENLFPNPMAGQSMRELEEERRLFYVALTRAGQYCFLSFARSRYRFGKMEFSNPSRFLQEIDSRFLASSSRASSVVSSAASSVADEPVRVVPPRVSGLKPLGQSATRPSASSPSSGRVAGNGMAALRAGQTIEHERFGIGEVISVEGTGENTKAKVKFRHAGEKQLLLRFARFKVLE